MSNARPSARQLAQFKADLQRAAQDSASVRPLSVLQAELDARYASQR